MYLPPDRDPADLRPPPPRDTSARRLAANAHLETGNYEDSSGLRESPLPRRWLASLEQLNRLHHERRQKHRPPDSSRQVASAQSPPAEQSSPAPESQIPHQLMRKLIQELGFAETWCPTQLQGSSPMFQEARKCAASIIMVLEELSEGEIASDRNLIDSFNKIMKLLEFVIHLYLMHSETLLFKLILTAPLAANGGSNEVSRFEQHLCECLHWIHNLHKLVIFEIRISSGHTLHVYVDAHKYLKIVTAMMQRLHKKVECLKNEQRVQKYPSLEAINRQVAEEQQYARRNGQPITCAPSSSLNGNVSGFGPQSASSTAFALRVHVLFINGWKFFNDVLRRHEDEGSLHFFTRSLTSTDIINA